MPDSKHYRERQFGSVSHGLPTSPRWRSAADTMQLLYGLLCIERNICTAEDEEMSSFYLSYGA